MRITVPPDHDPTCILEVGIKNPERWAEVKGAWINVLIPSGLKVGRCNQTGQAEEGGKWEEFHRHQLGTHPRSDYWNDIGWTFPPRLSRVVRFKLRLAGPGEYPVLFKLGAPSLYDELVEEGTIRIEEGDASPADRFGDLITRGERLHRSLRDGSLSDREARVQTMAWLLDANPLLTDAVKDEQLPQSPEEADSTELEDSVRSVLVALYVVADEQGRARD
jgi:hypothetical protein